MTTTTSKTAKPQNLWADADEIQGSEPRDKNTLIGVPFLITRIDYGSKSSRGYAMVTVQAQDTKGAEFYFTDASTGVRDELTQYLVGKGIEIDWEAGSYDVKLACRKGLRKQEYETEVRPDVFRDSYTFYIAKGE